MDIIGHHAYIAVGLDDDFFLFALKIDVRIQQIPASEDGDQAEQHVAFSAK